MPVSPSNVSDLTLRYTIKVNGSPIADTYPVVSINITNEVNRIPVCEIVLIDGTVEQSDFPISESSDFVPGNPVVITAAYGSETEVAIFTGVVVKQSLQISSASLHLVVTCKHKAVAMTFNRTDAIFKDKTDSDIMGAIAATHGITKSVDSTSVVYERMFQKLATDWDFILSRADFCGFVVSFDGEKMTIGKPKTDGSAVLIATFGESMISFNAELNAEKQPPGMDASSWDMKTQAMIKSTAAEPGVNSHGNLTAKKLSESLGQSTLSLISGAPMTKEALKAWADARLLRARLSALKGSVSFNGSALAKPDTIIELAGVGDRFNGSAYISSVKHNLEEGQWKTTVRFGLDYKPIHEQPDFSYPPAAGQVPSIHGLQIAVVKQLHEDPETQFRILVTLLSDDASGVWARYSNFYATTDAGSSFLPEVGDEVVVGFLENNPASPVILGSLYSSTRKSAYTAADSKNYTKAITTKGKLKISFNDEDKITKIETPGGNTFTLDDKAKAVNIVDQNSNSIKMTSAGIDIQSAKDIKLTATGKIVLDATAKLELKSAADVAVTGANITNTANVGFTAKGNATAEISASGQTVVKGGMVMIN